MQVADDGRGMPVDIHPKEKVSGAELILTRLHAGGKFSDTTYKFSGGLHGVGVSVVNALSKHLECWIRRGGKEYNIGFKDGKITSKLEVIGTVGQRNTGTTVRFWPDPKFFDSDKFSVPAAQARPEGQGGAVPGAAHHASRTRRPARRTSGSTPVTWAPTWSRSCRRRPASRPSRSSARSPKTMTRSTTRLCWAPDAEAALGESYVNLIPTSEGGTHVNGLRAGVAAAVREFCEFRNLVPRGLKLTPEDVWDKANYVLSIKMQEPQFAGQMKERLGSRDAAPLVEGFARDSMALWLNRHPDAGETHRAVRDRERAGARSRRRRRSCASASPAARRCPGSSPTASARSRGAASCSWSRATRPAARPSRRATRTSRRSCRCAARS